MMIEGVVLALVIVVGEVAVLSREVVVPLRDWVLVVTFWGTLAFSFLPFQ